MQSNTPLVLEQVAERPNIKNEPPLAANARTILQQSNGELSAEGIVVPPASKVANRPSTPVTVPVTKIVTAVAVLTSGLTTPDKLLDTITAPAMAVLASRPTTPVVISKALVEPIVLSPASIHTTPVTAFAIHKYHEREKVMEPKQGEEFNENNEKGDNAKVGREEGLPQHLTFN